MGLNTEGASRTNKIKHAQVYSQNSPKFEFNDCSSIHVDKYNGTNPKILIINKISVLFQQFSHFKVNFSQSRNLFPK